LRKFGLFQWLVWFRVYAGRIPFPLFGICKECIRHYKIKAGPVEIAVLGIKPKAGWSQVQKSLGKQLHSLVVQNYLK
jgi:hypothetical protein